MKRDPKIKELKGPIVCLGTHLAVLDVVTMMKSMNKYRKLNIVVGRDVMSWSVFKPIAKKLGFIPMSQFGLDLSSVRVITKAIKKVINRTISRRQKFHLVDKIYITFHLALQNF